MIAKKRVLVTGAGGFIGQHGLEPLRAAGYEVHAVLSARASFTPPAVAPPSGAQVHRTDLLDLQATDALIEAVRPTHLLHFASIVRLAGDYWNSAENYHWLAASRHLIRRFADSGGVRAVMAGSCAEYDWSRVGLPRALESRSANNPGKAVSAYAECKIALQQALEKFGREQGLSTAWGRLFFQFGPG